MDRHYWANAAMHGTDTQRLKDARKCCATVLKDQIDALDPFVVVSGGVQAATSLYEIGLVTKPWRAMRESLAAGPYTERTSSGVRVYCTYHPSATAVNCEVSKLYSRETEDLLKQKLDRLDDTHAAERFLKRWDRYGKDGQGMRVLLLHWLDIGEGIREAYGRA